MDVDSNTLSDTDRPKAEDTITRNALTAVNSHENCGCISLKQQMIALQFKSIIHDLVVVAHTIVFPETKLLVTQ